MTANIAGVDRGEVIEILVDDKPVRAWRGETLATVLLRERVPAFYYSRSGQPRLPICNMGACMECRVLVEQGGQTNSVLACLTDVFAGMRVTSGSTLHKSLAESLHAD